MRQVALIGETRMGKSAFSMANARGNIWGIDAEHGLENYTALAEGELFYPSKQGCVDPIHIFLEAEEHVWAKDVGTITVDSVTKIYGRQSRVASMANRLSAGQRESLGLAKNKAQNMTGKADAIQVLANLVVYGTDVFYIWHSGEYLDVEKYTTIVRDAISDTELGRLMTSVDIVLRFAMKKGFYTVYVDPQTRSRGRQPARTGFIYSDPVGNYWKNAMDRLERLIYQSFDGQDHAIKWASEELKRPEQEILDLYTQVKEKVDPKKPSEMWFAIVKEVDEIRHGTSVVRLVDKKGENGKNGG